MGCGRSSAEDPAGEDAISPKSVTREVYNEEDTLDGAVANAQVPSYWTNKRNADNAPFNQMIYLEKEQQAIFDQLLESTYAAVSTKDRPCPKKTNPCERQSQGCPCVQPDGNPGLPTGYRVRRVVRVENSAMWARYTKKLASIRAARSTENLKTFRPEVLTSQTVRDSKNIFQPLEWKLNETYLWHGPDVRTALSIAQENFNIDLAGSGRGAMYGPGAYFAESCTKADEYATDEPGGFYDGVRALLLCRVCMGKMYYTTKFGQEDASEKVSKGWCDSVLGDLSKFRMTFREFVVYDADQVYPEYVVLYSRTHRGDSADEIKRRAQTPFYLELPVYWRNCHVAPRVKAFAHEYRVQSMTLELLQRLVNSCMTSSAEVQLAYRVENSEMWNRYIDFKSSIRSACKATEKLESDVHTTQQLKKHFAGESISIENLEEHLNEHLLWYGTTKQGGHDLAHGSLSIANVGNGARFGQGAYMSDDLNKALSYCVEEDGIRHVLLCRACCGKTYTVEDECWQAHTLAQAEKKHSVFASADDAHIFVLFDSSQVYPEFILELKTTTSQRTRLGL